MTSVSKPADGDADDLLLSASCYFASNDAQRAPRRGAFVKSIKGNPMHRFQVGQSVGLIPRVIRQAAKGNYEIVRLMPENEDDPMYRIKSSAERYERVVPESELEPAGETRSASSKQLSAA
jgi:hypothetical protein